MMAIQSLPGSDLAIAESADVRYDRRKHLIIALNQLKSNIAGIEQRHTYLGNDLSSTCDKAILSLQGSPCLQETAAAIERIGAPSPAPETNPLSLAVDKTGTHIIKGLDKMGDGIIFLFLKISKPLTKRT